MKVWSATTSVKLKRKIGPSSSPNSKFCMLAPMGKATLVLFQDHQGPLAELYMSKGITSQHLLLQPPREPSETKHQGLL
jgi:hypothetical protein